METYFGFVYIWYDRGQKMFYIGSHYGSIDDNYVCSNTWMMNAYKKRRKDFKRKILNYVYEDDLQILHNKEQYWLDMIKDHELSTSKNVIAKTNRYYNMKKSAYGGSHPGHTKNRTKPPWNLGLTPEMIQLRREGLFSLLIDKPKPKNLNLKKTCPVCDKDFETNSKNEMKFCSPECRKENQKRKSRPKYHSNIIKPPKIKIIKNCPQCDTPFEISSRRQVFCSKECSYKNKKERPAWNKGIPNPKAAENGKKSALKQSQTVTGRKKINLDNGKWMWEYPNKEKG